MNLRCYRDIASYALYDAGNSNYITLGPSLGFQIYFAAMMVSSRVSSDFIWGCMIAGATLLAAAIGPKMGERVDRTGSKFSVLRWTSWAAVAGTVLLALLRPGQIVPAATVFVVTHTCYLLATVLYDSALADVSTRENAAAVSSLAWGVGYAGGVIGLVLALALKGGGEQTRLAKIFLTAAGLFMVLSLPLCLHRRSRAAASPRTADPRPSLLSLVRSFMGDATRGRMLAAYFLYSNGVSAVVYFTAAYAKTTLGYGLDDLIRLFIVMNLVAAPSSIVLGRVAGKVGQIRTLKAVVGAWVAVVVVIAFSNDRVFAVVACAAAALLGPVQALSRSLFRIIFPEDRMSSFFGIQSVATRGSALFGPLLFGAVSGLSGSQRLAALTAAVLFAAGLLVLFFVPTGAEAGQTNGEG